MTINFSWHRRWTCDESKPTDYMNGVSTNAQVHFEGSERESRIYLHIYLFLKYFETRYDGYAYS